ncbi:MAG: response regulator transcription factor [Terriglobales bacterium]
MEVAIFAAHPLMLERMRLQLQAPQFQVHSYLISNAAQLASLPLPPADACAVDVHELALAEQLILRLPPRPPLVAVAEELARPRALALLRLGARGLVLYERLPQELARALETVSGGEYWIRRRVMAEFVDDLLACLPHPGPGLGGLRLSPRERQVLEGIAAQRSNKEMAAALGLSERTVKFHVSNLLRRSGARDRHELALRLLHSRPPDETA